MQSINANFTDRSSLLLILSIQNEPNNVENNACKEY